MNNLPGRGSRIRFRALDDFQRYLEKVGDGRLDFRAYPVSGSPENFHYDGREKAVTREKDGRMFDSVEDFLCYAFQCDDEGCSHTEYVDIEVIN
ncbi:hypothetical protein JOC37_002598 [Desulfohalotomaculum tongense]|uniref:hypothetical protein n=1 Tax=Desulforadius tongensis TaxID=1216062 RepID=UPI00195DA386|nr:hypothetical protein [Desulforadius tongensis]MBM7856165.1 hypothetical protein [Desulforadius tongensis]